MEVYILNGSTIAKILYHVFVWNDYVSQFCLQETLFWHDLAPQTLPVCKLLFAYRREKLKSLIWMIHVKFWRCVIYYDFILSYYTPPSFYGYTLPLREVWPAVSASADFTFIPSIWVWITWFFMAMVVGTQHVWGILCLMQKITVNPLTWVMI